MTTLKLQFSGHIKKVSIRQAGVKNIAEVQLCKKHAGKDGAPDAFTWIKVTIWEPKDWQSAKMVAGAYISGCGDFSLRSYVKSDQTKGVSAEIRCSSFDVDMPDDRDHAVKDAPPRESERPVAAPQSVDEPPF